MADLTQLGETMQYNDLMISAITKLQESAIVAAEKLKIAENNMQRLQFIADTLGFSINIENGELIKS